MKNLQLIIAIVFLCAHNISHSQEKTYLSNAVNIAGKQRMLGQRMAKDKVYMKANEKKSEAEVEQEKAILAFEKGIDILKKFAPTETIKYKVGIQEYAFKRYKSVILERNNASLKEILKTNTLFLAICDDVVTELINYSKTKPKDNVNKYDSYVIDKISAATGASGKLRYLTQRLTLYFAMNEFGQKTVTPFEIDEIVQTMDKNLNYLTVLEFNTLDIDDSLSEVVYYWNQLKDRLYVNGEVSMAPDKLNAVLLYDLCNTVLSKANATTKMYADLNKQ